MKPDFVSDDRMNPKERDHTTKEPLESGFTKEIQLSQYCIVMVLP